MESILITIGQLSFSLIMYAIGTIFFALALIPGIALVIKTWLITLGMNSVLRFFCPRYQFICCLFFIRVFLNYINRFDKGNFPSKIEGGGLPYIFLGCFKLGFVRWIAINDKFYLH